MGQRSGEALSILPVATPRGSNVYYIPHTKKFSIFITYWHTAKNRFLAIVHSKSFKIAVVA